jgi:hypothetical protein
MSELPNDSTSKLPTVAEAIADERDQVPARRGGPETATCVSASHTILFESEGERCSVCDEPIASDDADDEDAMDIGGRGLLVWARGDERRYEEPRLCPSCASAIGVTALQRWEIEEDEG